MPAIPAITLHKHVTLDSSPVRLDDETYLLMQRARVTASSGDSQRFKDLLGNCFLRVESDQRLQYSIDFFVLQSNGLADYYPGRSLTDRAIAFATGTEQRHQFGTDGIFIYESATDEDPQGELRSGNVVISYDLHTGLDSTTFPATTASTEYVDVPANAAATEISDTAKNLMLQDIFYGESNLDAAFTCEAYDGNPAGVALTSVTAALATDLLTKVAHGLKTGERVVLTAMTDGAGLTVGNTYYVYRASADTFKLCTTFANSLLGTGVDITTDGTAGTVTPGTNGSPIATASLLGTYSTARDAWTPTGYVSADRYHWYASPQDAITFDSNASLRACSWLRLKRGSNIICDIPLDAVLSVTANKTLRVPVANIQVALDYFWGYSGDGCAAGASDEDGGRWMIQYVLGGNRANFLPALSLTLEIYASDPGTSTTILPIYSFGVDASSAAWTISGNTVAPAVALDSPTLTAEEYTYSTIIVRLGSLRARVISRNVSGTVPYGTVYSSSTDAKLNLDAS